MKQEQFEKIIETQLQRVKDVLFMKQKEYATEDRLHNFRVVSGLRDCTMEQALGGMLSKHTVSIYDMIESGKEYEPEQWNEKINDHIVYLLLLQAITEERRIERLNGLMTGEELYQPAVNNMRDYDKVTRPDIKHQPLKEFLHEKGFELADLSKKNGWYHDPNSPHLTSDELLLALEIKEILNKRGWTNSNER